MHWIGVRSYSLYLVHVAAMIAVLQWSGLAPLGPGRFVRMLAIDLPVSIALAALSYAIVERPFLALRGRWRAPRSTDAATEAGGGTG